MTITVPPNPIAAVTHPDPYPYYADLVARNPIYRDETVGLWVASSAKAVSAVLTSEICRVRPPAEPVPRALLGSPAADIFRHLVRMNDGERHCPFKRAVSTTLQSIEIRTAAERSRKWARVLLGEKRIPDFAFHLPVYVVADLLGVPQEALSQTALWMGDFVRCLAPASSREQIERGKVAAGHLFELFQALLDVEQTGSTRNLLATLLEQAKGVGSEDRDSVIANGIGFLSQAYEATAGLIGNTLVLLGTHHDIYRQVVAQPDLLRLVIEEVLRYDSPIQNTRRFLAQSGRVAGQEMNEGDVVLVVLASANRDPVANPAPDLFDLFRKDRRLFTFGVGPHLCPGEMLAAVIARAGVEQLLASGFDPEQFAGTISYRPSGNARVALLAERMSSEQR
jgi:cytochrome P450